MLLDAAIGCVQRIKPLSERSLNLYYHWFISQDPKAISLLAMVLLGVRTEPQGQAYLPPSPPSPRPGGGGGGHPDEWIGDPANYEFSYEVQDAVAGLDFGHREMRKDTEATGTYHVLLPDGRMQIVDYIADEAGYRPMVRYEGTATYPAPSGPSGPSGPAIPAPEEGYRY